MVVSRLRRESCQQYRQAAGAVAEALIGADWTRHHTTTDSTLAVFRGRGCIDSLRLYPHAHPVLAADLVVDGDGTRDRQKRAYARRNCLYGEVSDLKIPERADQILRNSPGRSAGISASPVPTFTMRCSGRSSRFHQPPPSA